MEVLTTIINSAIIFLCSNILLYNKGYEFNLPVVLFVILFIFINFFPTILAKKLYDDRLVKVRNGYRLLSVFLIDLIGTILFYIASIFEYHVNGLLLIWNLLIVIFLLSIVFWNGMLRVYLHSKQLGIRYRGLGLLLGIVPIANIVMLVKIINVCYQEVEVENSKLKLNKKRAKDEICKTKYPVLLVHGVFFRDYEFFNYWGRIPEELEKNGCKIYYGNHSSALGVPNSAKELASRIKSIIKETGCEKVNIIAHSKGGLDARYAISNYDCDKYVASLTTINTPNKGCYFADYLFEHTPDSVKEGLAKTYNAAMKKLGDKKPDFLEAVYDLTSSRVKELNSEMKHKEDVYYQSFGSRLKKSKDGRFPMNFTNKIVKYFDGYNDGLVGESSFQYGENYTFLESTTNRGISHADIIDLNRENYPGFDVREFYVKIVNGLKKKGF